MIRRREAKEICRTTKVDQCAGTNEYVDRIRATPAAAETCFVIDTDALPVEAAAVIAEKTALVVRVPESWLDNVDMLGRDYDLRPFFRSGGNQVSSGANWLWARHFGGANTSSFGLLCSPFAVLFRSCTCLSARWLFVSIRSATSATFDTSPIFLRSTTLQ